jgi:hypothetical protein
MQRKQTMTMIYVTQERLAVMLRSIACLPDPDVAAIVRCATEETAAAEVRAQCAQAEDLAMMIRRLVSALRKARPCAPQDLDYQALDLLRRHGLEGSVLRDVKPNV